MHMHPDVPRRAPGSERPLYLKTVQSNGISHPWASAGLVLTRSSMMASRHKARRPYDSQLPLAFCEQLTSPLPRTSPGGSAKWFMNFQGTTGGKDLLLPLQSLQTTAALPPGEVTGTHQAKGWIFHSRPNAPSSQELGVGGGFPEMVPLLTELCLLCLQCPFMHLWHSLDEMRLKSARNVSPCPCASPCGQCCQPLVLPLLIPASPVFRKAIQATSD